MLTLSGRRPVHRASGWRSVIVGVAALVVSTSALTLTTLGATEQPAEARPATGGVGRFGGAIDWVEWGTASQPLPNTGFTGTTTRSIGGQQLTVSCSTSNIVTSAGVLEAYRPGTWTGDALDDMYNIGGTGGANQLVNALSNRTFGATVAFDYTCAATLDGAPVPLAGLVFADAEQNLGPEYVAATAPAGSTFRVIDRFRNCGQSVLANLSTANRLQLTTTGNCQTGPAAVAFIEGATSARVDMRGARKSAVALGVVIAVDHGDAPESYGDAAHLVSYSFTGGEVPVGVATRVSDPAFTLGTAAAPRRLGGTVDPDGEPQYSADATGDDALGSDGFGPADDEDGLLSPASVTGVVGAPYAVSVDCRSAGDALAGWIDWNGDGDFLDAGERSQTSTCAAGGEPTVVTWPAIPGDVVGQPVGTTTVLRLRTALDPSGIAQPTGLARSGEVEDHAVTLDVGPGVEVVKQLPDRADPADQFRVSLQTGTGTPVADATTAGTATSATTGPRIVDDGVAYQVTESIVAGPRTLASYDTSIACTDANTGTPVAVTGSRPTWTLPPLPADARVVCTITNDGYDPAISLEKTATLADADGDGLADVGETISYAFVVTNTGDVPVTAVTVDDPSAGRVTCSPTTLPVGGTSVCRAVDDHVVTQADVDAGSITNTATAGAAGPDGNAVTSTPDSTEVLADQSPSLTVEKSAALNDRDGDDLADVGETVSYSFVVTNTGTTTLTDVGVTDDLAGPVTCAQTTLAPGRSTTCRADTAYVVTEADLYAGSVDNSATAQGTPPTGPAVDSEPDTTSTATAEPAPSVAIDKFADWDDTDTDGAIDVGETIAYSFLVTNTGDVTLTGIAVDDDLVGPVTCADTTLAPGAQTRCAADDVYVVTQADIDSPESAVVNTATASGTPAEGGPVTSAPDSTTTPGSPDPQVRLVKTAEVDPASHRGALEVDDTITYAFTVTNVGNVTLTEVGVDDPTLGTVTCLDTTLAPGEATTCTAPTRTVTQGEFDAGDPLVNTASATGTAPDDTVVDDEDSVTLVVAPASPALAIVKVATVGDTDADGTLEVGETIDFTFTVTNTGDVTIDDVTVDDPLAGPVTCTPTSLAPTEEATCSADDPYVVSQDDVDAGRVVNTATASATPSRPGGDIVSEPDSTTTLIDAVPALELVKTATLDDSNGSGTADAGEQVAYAFTVTNTGPLTLVDVAVADPSLGSVACTPTRLAPGESARCTADSTRTVTQADVDAGLALTNTATATGFSRGGTEASDDDTARVPVAEPEPGIGFDKRADLADTDGDGTADVGEVISYTFVVTNTGNVTLDDVGVDDPSLAAPVICPRTTLAPTESVTCTTSSTRTVTQADVDAGDPLTNRATATGTPPSGPAVSGSDTASTPVTTAAASLELTKVASLSDEDGDGAIDVGETITYLFRVENTGNVTLGGLTVGDAMLGAITCDVTELAPGTATTCTAGRAYVVTQADVDAGSVRNTAVVTATGPQRALVTDADTIVTPSAPSPGLTLDKTAALADADADGLADPGESITYGFTVTNTGNTTLTGVAVADPALGTVTCARTTLAPGEQTTCAGPARVVGQDDLEAQRPVTNTATATATAPGGASVGDTGTASLPIAPAMPALEVEKEGDLRGDRVLDAGDTIAYRFTVTNSGDVTITDVRIRDPRLRGGRVLCETTSLAPGGSTTCRATYEVTAADARRGRVRNVARAEGDRPDGGMVTSEPSQAVVVSRAGEDDSDDDPEVSPDDASPGQGDQSGGDDLLPSTGGPLAGVIVLGPLLIGAGLWLLRRSRAT